MACEITPMSCSLCPFCATENCPRFVEKQNDGKYWIYALNRKESVLEVQFNTNNKAELIDALKKIAKQKKWAKKFQHTIICKDLDKKTGRYGYVHRTTTPIILLTITNGEYNWYNSVELALDLESGTLYRYKDEHLTYEGTIKYTKEWNGKLVFRYR